MVVKMRREEMWEQEEKGAVQVGKRAVVCSSSWAHLPSVNQVRLQVTLEGQSRASHAYACVRMSFAASAAAT